MVNTAVILAAGLGSRLKEHTAHKPKGFLVIDDLPIIERSILQLRKSEIEHIWIGTGYLSQEYERLAQKYPQVNCVYNDRYRDSGSMYTLYNMRESVREDFLLLESDLLYDIAGLKNLLADTRSDVILSSGATHSNDEVYIEMDEEGHLIAMSKQIELLGRVDAELVGISKVSLDTYQRMCRLVEAEFHNHLKWDYEQALVEVGKKKPIAVKKIEKFTWCEIDTEEHLQRAKEVIYPKLKQPAAHLSLPIKRNILLNPGPATTTDTVKLAQIVPDICPREQEFGDLMEWIAEQLTVFVAPKSEYDTVLFSGSGTAAVESVISSVIGEGKLLILSNGAYGERMAEIAQVYHIDYEVLESSSVLPLSLDAVEASIIRNKNKLTHVAVVHNETTSGILNDIDAIGKLCALHEVDLIVDAMSSYGAIPINMKASNLSFLISSSNKNLQGMAGISFIVACKEKLQKIKEYSPKSYYLDLYKQYEYFQRTHQLRFTPPVQTFYALEQAIIETQNEGIEQRYRRYTESWQTLIKGLDHLQLQYLVPIQYHSRIITSIKEPTSRNYEFGAMHDYLYNNGFTIYPGKIGQTASFRVANIGAITYQDIERFLKSMEEYLSM
ncbi:2-aminoethylphosphonate--pyruvate transaminase [Paenibacillus kribbensis]|uniref:2-aminoethylphosphonate--pyruvate transaminase n=1 Tax=Paenibacillus kribbensis TaxID=172713 RepID=A0A222WNY0_9BACL|nr:2-aminoethylphosphonate--pyruvate transaminase [Paenibacillus kribbensis]ASR48227.1 2-aminoethylphosphonate--pyruvate transaminase [Paenibacillus kribbensis]